MTGKGEPWHTKEDKGDFQFMNNMIRIIYRWYQFMWKALIYITKCTMYNTMYNYTMYNVNYNTMCNVQDNIQYNVQYNVQYDVQCTVQYNV